MGPGPPVVHADETLRGLRALLLLNVRPEASSDPVCFLETELPDLIPLRASSGDGPCHVNVKVRDGLVRSNPVVLPNADAWSLFYLINR